MERNTNSSFYSWILLIALVCWIVRCGKLDGYLFPVYTTSSCPRNQSEWKNRSFALNCTDSNGYICIPNENITKQLEFCYRYPRIPIEKGICLFLKRSTSLVEAYRCNHFRNGCPNKQYWSNEIFRYPSCLSIGNRCFLAEPFCDEQGFTTLGSLGATKTQDETNVHFGQTTLNTSFGSTVSTENRNENNAWVWIIIGVLLILIILGCVVVIIFIRRRRRRKRRFYKDFYMNLPFERCNLTEREKYYVGGIGLDGYKVWKTKMSEKYQQLTTEERSVLFLILCSDRNTLVLEDREKLKERFSLMLGAFDFSNGISESIQAMQSKGFVSIEDKNVTFASDDVQDETMFDYLHTKLVKSSHSYSVISKVSLESSVKYFRSREYREGKYVRCFPGPETFGISRDILTRIISKFGRDLLLYAIMDDKGLHSTISAELKIPEEVLRWDMDARKRYLEYLKKGKTPIFRSRAMIVGCAGAGKTTLLKRLQNKSMDEIKAIKSTVGLDVHNDIFVVQEETGKLQVAVHKCEPALNIKENVPLKSTEEVEKKKLLSILDFGGQCMYYACHQIYLSKRAFYILVVDMSKDLEMVIDEELCDQKDTMFSEWSHKDYLSFWLKSVDCYCGHEAPVILVATHADGKSEKEKTRFYKEIINTFPEASTIKEHLSSKRYFMISLPMSDEYSLENLDELERCIVDVAQSQKQWGEEVPKDWVKFEEFILQKKTTKLQRLSTLKESFDELLPLTKQEFADLLRFYHDIGLILYFSFKDPRFYGDTQHYLDSNVVILDIQWFVNSFKYVVTDSKQESVTEIWDVAPTMGDLNTFTKTGEISGKFLEAIWKATDNPTAAEYKDDMVKYMERLGLMAIEEEADMYFIPSMNRMKIPEKVKSKIHECYNKSPILYFRFPVLPIFVFYRLIVLCLKQWDPLRDGEKCIYIDTAMFAYEEHVLVLGVSESYIQLMLYRDDENPVEMTVFSEVKRKVLVMLSSLTKTFNSDLRYVVGYSCTPTEFSKELGKTFIPEFTILNHYGKACPLHAHADHNTEFLKTFLERLKLVGMVKERERLEKQRERWISDAMVSQCQPDPT